MGFDLKSFGGKLQRCRTQLQLRSDEVCGKTGIDEIRLAQLERGDAEPTGDEVLIFADLYKQNYEYFISSQQTAASEQVEILYRQNGDDFSREDRWAVQEFIFLCEAEQFFFQKLDFRPIRFDFTPEGSYFKSHGAQAAAKLRESLGLNNHNIMTDPYSTFRQLGIHIFRRQLSNSDISGFFINHPTAGKCVLVNYDEDIYRQNFTLAHEIGHTIFDFLDPVNISFESQRWSKSELKEVRANSFASNFLIPKAIFVKYDAGRWTDDHILAIAKQLQVNPGPVLISMKETNVISEETYKEKRQLKIPVYEKTDPELKNLSPKYLQAKITLLQKGLSTFYVRKAYECYESGFISAGRLAEVLLCSEAELREILDLFNMQLIYEY